MCLLRDNGLLAKTGSLPKASNEKGIGLVKLLEAASKAYEQPSVCFPYDVSDNGFGHPRVRVNGRLRVATCWVLEAELGRPLLVGELVRHKCNNPSCINPHHLEPGSVGDNVADAYKAKRRKPSNKENWKTDPSIKQFVLFCHSELELSQHSIARLTGLKQGTVSTLIKPKRVTLKQTVHCS